jgi:DNA-binding XRE family transcriptional regulator
MARLRQPTQEVVAGWLLLVPWWRPWSNEGPARRVIRSDLCLQGSRWKNADEVARRLVARAASIVNGQPRPRGWDTDNELAQWMPDAECTVCGRWFVAWLSGDAFCGRACRHRAAEMQRWSERTAPPQCLYCNRFFEGHWNQDFCTPRCQDRAGKSDARERAGALLGQEIANRRRANRWTQSDLARRLEIHPRYLGQIEEGRVAASQELLDRIWLAIADEPTGRHCKMCFGEIPPGKDPRAVFCRVECSTAWWNAERKRRANGHDTTAETAVAA